MNPGEDAGAAALEWFGALQSQFRETLAEPELRPAIVAGYLPESTTDQPGHRHVTPLTLTFLCVLSAAAMSMVFPVRPSVNAITDFFPASVPGFDQELGVTVLSRVQRGAPTGDIRAGSFIVRPEYDQSVTHDDNVLGFRGSPASWIVHSAPTISVNSDWGRNSLGAYIGLDNGTYLDTPRQSRTDWTAAIGGGLTIGRGEATLAYSHLTLHDDATNIGALPTSTPVPFVVDDVRASYTVPVGRFALTPFVDYAMWRFGTTELGGQPSNQDFRNRDVLQAGLAGKFDLGGGDDLLMTAAAIDTHYVHPNPGVAGQSSTSGIVLAGFDWQATGNTRIRVLGGVETRQFVSAAYASRTTPVGTASLIWTPTGLTTVTATLSRSIEDPSQEDTGGIVFSRAQLDVDHELMRDVILRGRIGVQAGEFLQLRSNQTNVYAGAGVTWIINRHLRLSTDYQFTNQSGAAAQSVPGVTNINSTTGNYSRNLFIVRLHVST